MTDRSKDQRLDERTALDELEQFQSEIKRYRQQRESATSDFAEFVRTLPPPEEVFPTEKATAPPPASTSASQHASPRPPEGGTTQKARTPTGSVAPEARSRVSSNEGVSAEAPLRRDESAAPVRPAKKRTAEPAAVLTTPGRTGSRTPLLAALLIVALVIAGVMYWNGRPAEPAGDGTATAPAAESAPPPAAAPETPAPAPSAAAEAAKAATGSEVTTLRPVWVRVIVDGERLVEREFPAGAKIPFTAEKTIVIRTGDAGAVRLVIRGEDQGALGRDGAVVTRTFTVPPGEPR